MIRLVLNLLITSFIVSMSAYAAPPTVMISNGVIRNARLAGAGAVASLDQCTGTASLAAIGAQCVTGPLGGAQALYAGTYNGYKYMTTPGGCTNWVNSTNEFTPTCAGGNDTVTKQWAANDGRTPTAYGVLTSATATDNGITNTATLNVNYADTDAVKYCAHMVYGGYDDWYLPSGSWGASGCTNYTGEFYNVLFRVSNLNRPNNNGSCNAAIVAGPLGGFVSGSYFTSTDASTIYARHVNFSNGYQCSINNKASLFYMRCVRRY